MFIFYHFFPDRVIALDGRGRNVMVVSKTKHSKTKTEARSTQISKTKHPRSKTKHPKLDNEAPLNLENQAPKTRTRSTQISKTKTQNSKTKHPISKTKKTWHRSVLHKHENNVNTAEINKNLKNGYLQVEYVTF